MLCQPVDGTLDNKQQLHNSRSCTVSTGPICFMADAASLCQHSRHIRATNSLAAPAAIHACMDPGQSVKLQASVLKAQLAAWAHL